LRAGLTRIGDVMPELTPYSAFGVFGVVMYLLAYGALQAGLIRGTSLAYTILNMVAAASVLLSLMETWNLYSALIQIFWIAISIMGIGRRIWLRSRRAFDDETLEFLARHLPALPLHEAHRLMRHATWQDHPAETVLTRKGEPVDALLYLGHGTATVRVGERRITGLSPGALMGEMTLIHGGGATATVSADGPVRILHLPRTPMLAEMNAAPDVALAVGHALQTEVQRKLVDMNSEESDGISPEIPSAPSR
jgi:hypothetical protein